MRTTRYLAVAAVALAACQASETQEQMQARIRAESDSARALIEQAAAAFGRLVSAGHADSLALMYAENAVLMPPNMPPATGRAAIRETFAGMLAGGPTTVHLAVGSVVANGPIAIESGRYHMTMQPPAPAPAMTDSGKYLVHWHRVDGAWRMAEDIWNSDVPVEAPAPARRR